MNELESIHNSIKSKGAVLYVLGRMGRKDFYVYYGQGRVQKYVRISYPELEDVKFQNERAAFEVIHSIARLRTYIQGLEGLEKGVKSELAATLQNAFLRALFIRTELARLGFGEGIALKFMGLRPLEITDLRIISRVFFQDEEFLLKQCQQVIEPDEEYISLEFLQGLRERIKQIPKPFEAVDLFRIGLYDQDNAEREKLMVELGFRRKQLEIGECEQDEIKNVIIIPILQTVYLISLYIYINEDVLRLINIQLNSRVLATEPRRILSHDEWGKRKLGLVFFLKVGLKWFNDDQIARIEEILRRNIEELETWLQDKTGEPT